MLYQMIFPHIVNFFPIIRLFSVVNNTNTSATTLSQDLNGSILGLLLFIIYINALSNDLFSNCIFFPDNATFSVVNNTNTSATTLSQDLNATANWAF